MIRKIVTDWFFHDSNYKDDLREINVADLEILIKKLEKERGVFKNDL